MAPYRQPVRPKWWNGRHGGLKIRCGQPRGGSTPPFGTTLFIWRSIDDLGVRSSTAPPWYPDLGWIAPAPCWESFSVLSELINNVPHRFPERTKIDPSRFLFPKIDPSRFLFPSRFFFPIRRPAPEWVPVTLGTG